MWISRQAAKFYVTDDVIGDMADRIARAVQQQQPIDLDAERRPPPLGLVAAAACLAVST